jgi:DNA-binding MarR family transcriptional regulator
MLVDGSDLRFRQLIQDLFVFASRAQEVRGLLAQSIGLTGIELAVLIAIMHLRRTEGKIGINEIAYHLHLSGAFVTNEVNKLVAAGLIIKTPNPNDRRRVILEATGDALKRLELVAEVLRPVNDTWFEPLSENDFAVLGRIMSVLVVGGDRALKLTEFLLQKPKLTRKR